MHVVEAAFRWLVKVMVNLRFAVVLLSVIAIVAILATLLGEEQQAAILRSGPFSGLMIVLMFALALAVASRWPWKKTHTGWIMTHAGLIIIVIGHMLTGHYGFEGRVDLWEGQATTAMEQEEWVVTAEIPQDGGRLLRSTIDRVPSDPARPGTPPPDAPIADRSYTIAGGDTITIDRFWPTYSVRTSVVPIHDEGAPFSPALALELRAPEDDGHGHAGHAHGPGEGHGRPQKTTAWLVADDAQESAKGFGESLRVYHQKLPSAGALQQVLAGPDAQRAAPARVIALAGGDSIAEVALDKALAGPQPVGTTGFKIHVHQKFDRFRFDGRPVEGTDGPLNPALVVEVIDPSGKSEHRFVFTSQDITPRETISPPFELRYEASLASALPPSSVFFLEVLGQKAPTVIVVDPGGRRTTFPLALGQAFAIPWIGIEAVATDRYESARVVRTEWCSSYSASRPALHVRLARADGQGPEQSTWLVWNPDGSPTRLDGTLGPIDLRYGPRKVALPFRIQLERFHLETYEGTDNPMSFESFVRVFPLDGKEKPFQYHIYMNHPLTFAGYTFFQSSYDPETLRRSIFQVSYDPGWRVVYLGYTLTILGVFFIVYLKPILVRREAARLAAAGLARVKAKKDASEHGENENENENEHQNEKQEVPT